MHNDQILYLINEWSGIPNHDIILELLSNKNTSPKKFHFYYCPYKLHLKVYIDVYGQRMFY